MSVPSGEVRVVNVCLAENTFEIRSMEVPQDVERAR